MRVDARIKVICAIVAILSLWVLVHWQTALAVFAACTFLAIFCGVPLKSYFRGMLYPFYIIAVVALIHPFTYGSTVIARVPILSLPIFIEGAQFGILIFSRCLAAVSVLVLLIQTTSIVDVISALRWFRAPSILLDITLLMLRYIFVISEEAETIYRAQESRCGYSKGVGLLRKLKNYGTLFGMLLTRSYERAVQVGNAMISRGYTGRTSIFTFEGRPIFKHEILYGIISCLALAGLILIDRILMV